MIAKVTLYKSQIEKNKNFFVDSIETYLSSLGVGNTLSFSNVQYQKIQLYMTVKLDIVQEFLEYTSLNNYNYCKIQNTTSLDVYGKSYYFFIEKKEWVSQSAVKLYLTMDTVNTFKPNIDFTFNQKTHINRQHKDRFTKGTYTTSFQLTGEAVYDPNENANYYEQTFDFEYGALTSNCSISNIPATIQIATINGSTNSYTIKIWAYEPTTFTVTVNLEYNGYRAIVDPYSEGLTPILYKTDEKYIETTGVSWNLIYKNNNAISPTDYNQVNPVRCYLAPDEDLPIQVRVSPNVTYATDLQNNTDYCVCVENNNRLTTATYRQFMVKIGSSYYDLNLRMAGITSLGVMYECYYLKMRKSNLNIECSLYTMRYRYTNNQFHIFLPPQLVTTITVSEVHWAVFGSEVYYSTVFNDRDLQSGQFNLSGYQTRTLLGINSLDRTDSQIVKVIKLPYCPVELTQNNDNSYIFPDTWEYDGSTGFMVLDDLNEKLESKIEVDDNPLRVLEGYWKQPTIDDFRINLNDPKLLHSDFYLPKYVYDSFVYPIALENVDNDEVKDKSKLDIEFITSNSVNSRFLFKFGVPLKRTSEDYENLLYVSRNNEVTIFSNQFINYLRNGYNYDVKAKERQDLASYIGLGSSIVGNIASVGLGIASGNPAVAVSSIIGAGSSLTNTIISTINGVAQREANLEQKMAQLKMQATTVSGADDLDLLIAYSRNRLKKVIYRASEVLRQALDDLFYYSGYATDELGTPDMSSRKWFNYVACDLVANTISYIPSDMESDLVRRYSEGVTFLHANYGVYDFSQLKENWEVSIF